jgi:hypothetical protein
MTSTSLRFHQFSAGTAFTTPSLLVSSTASRQGREEPRQTPEETSPTLALNRACRRALIQSARADLFGILALGACATAALIAGLAPLGRWSTEWAAFETLVRTLIG